MDTGGVRWSADTRQADWIAERLAPWDIRPFGDDSALRVTTVVPGGFESYARLLHPAAAAVTAVAGSSSGAGGRRVRWAEVAAWSGLPLSPRGGFHTVALPPFRRPDPPPFEDGPRVGSLDLTDAAALADVLRGWTTTPDDCWFCLWEGFGWESGTAVTGYFVASDTAAGEVPMAVAAGLRDPVPGSVRAGPRVRLPHRDYLLYRGAAAAITALAEKEQTANLAWPADRAWCVATDIDHQSSYVGGPAALIDALIADPRLEAVPAQPDDPVSRVLAPWVAAWVDDLSSAVLADGDATLETSRGTVRARLRRRPRGGAPSVYVEVNGDDGRQSSSGSWAPSGHPNKPSDDPERLRREIVFALTNAILGLAPEE